mmetsp:Transcript_37018/g.110860  ORF Transcript_37018/g.110860 Transcript_37018/m.110860 type:complete len:309 (-) Transcript_37018:65-991(-)
MEQGGGTQSDSDESLVRTDFNATIVDTDSVHTSHTAPSSYDGDGSDVSDETLRLQRTVEAAGLYSTTFGVSSIEIWVLRRRAARLERLDGGWWVDSSLASSTSGPETGVGSTNKSIDTLLGERSPPTVSPGVGLPGALWSETGAVVSPSSSAVREWVAMSDEERAEDLRRAAAGESDPESLNKNVSPVNRGHQGVGRRGMMKGLGQSFRHSLRHVISGDSRGVIWRELGPMSRDPDRPNDARLTLYVRAGFDLAAGVRVEVADLKGVVIFLASGTADLLSLRSDQCKAYLRHAAGVIGAAYIQSQSSR